MHADLFAAAVENDDTGQPRVRAGSAKKGRWFRFRGDVAPRENGRSRPETDYGGPVLDSGRSGGLLHRQHRSTCGNRHAARHLALVGLMARRAGLGHFATWHVRRRSRLTLRHQDARRCHSDAVPGETEENAQAQQMAKQLQHGFLMRRNMARVNSSTYLSPSSKRSNVSHMRAHLPAALPVRAVAGKASFGCIELVKRSSKVRAQAKGN